MDQNPFNRMRRRHVPQRRLPRARQVGKTLAPAAMDALKAEATLLRRDLGQIDTGLLQELTPEELGDMRARLAELEEFLANNGDSRARQFHS